MSSSYSVAEGSSRKRMSTQSIERNRPFSLADREIAAVFLAVFLYALSAGLLIQLVILPEFLPQIHGGHGLLKGVDSGGFHEIASEMAHRVAAKGWSEWQMSPSSHSPAGIAAALYAITGIHEPYVLLPINAALFALSGAAIFGIVRLITENVATSLAAVLPFVLFPSAALEYADMHKDVWSCAGSLIVIFALANIQASDNLKMRDIVLLALVCLAGALLVWIARAYLVRVLLYASAISVATVLLIDALVRRLRLDRTFAKKCMVCLMGLGVLGGVTRIPTEDATRGMAEARPLPQPSSPITRPGEPPGTSSGTSPAMTPSWSLPTPAHAGVLENVAISLAGLRRGFLTTYSDAGSLIDEYVVLAAPKDFLAYAPRALQIGFLAPFPSMWFSPGVSPGAGMMRALTGVEMAVSYVLLLGILLAIPFAAGRIWRVGILVLLLCVLVIGLMAVAVPIVGTLYRMRYGYFMLPVGLGAAGWVVLAGRYGRRTGWLR